MPDYLRAIGAMTTIQLRHDLHATAPAAPTRDRHPAARPSAQNAPIHRDNTPAPTPVADPVNATDDPADGPRREHHDL